jgi:hypothetical protein
MRHPCFVFSIVILPSIAVCALLAAGNRCRTAVQLARPSCIAVKPGQKRGLNTSPDDIAEWPRSLRAGRHAAGLGAPAARQAELALRGSPRGCGRSTRLYVDEQARA